jgi:hypothetical protein
MLHACTVKFDVTFWMKIFGTNTPGRRWENTRRRAAESSEKPSAFHVHLAADGRTHG